MDTNAPSDSLNRSAAQTLSAEERVRYSRHLTLPNVGVAGQQRLKAARVLLVGAGGLGSPTALYLAAAGVGTIGLVDQDTVDVTNLQRQLLYSTTDVGRPKLDAARERLHGINPHVQVETHAAWLTLANALDILRRYDVVVDGTDNFATRYLVNDACVLLGIPNVHGSIYQFEGQASVFATATGPCYRCLYPEPPPPGTVPSCAEGGVLGVLPGLIGTMQAIETIKLILGIGDTLAGRLLMVDTLTMQFRTVQLSRDPQCPACGTRTITALIDYDEFCGTPALSAAAPTSDVPVISVASLASRLARGDALQLIDVREPHETAVSGIDSAKLIPLGTLGDVLPTLDASQEFVVFCRSGKRSASAVNQMQRSGFARVWSLDGGMLEWEAAH